MNVRLSTHVLRSEIVRIVFIVTVSNLCLYCHSKSMFGDGQGKGKKGILTSKVTMLWPYPGRRMTLPEWQFFHRNMLSLILKRLAWDVCQDDLENYLGRQRSIRWRKGNPNVKDTIYTDNTKPHFSVKPVGRNVALKCQNLSF